jgi:hypothetical protein
MMSKCDGCNEPTELPEARVRYYCRDCTKLLDLGPDLMLAPAPADPITETWPDLPPIRDERAYQSCLEYIRMLEQRGVTGDDRTEHGMLLAKLRRSAKLYREHPRGVTR